MKEPKGYMAEAELLEDQKKFLEKKLDRLIKQGGPGELRTDESYLDADNIHGSGSRKEAMTLLTQIFETQQELAEVKLELSRIINTLNRAKELAQLLDDNKKKVRYLRDFCGMSLVEIADEINLSYDRVRHISQEINQELKNRDK